MKYRSEIDGLRAIAVIPVMLFHAGFESFRGGFVGVDVFFVISGYLITSLIHEEIQQNSFSIVRFYERRIRRILPALFVVCLACIPFAWVWMLPSEFTDFSRSLSRVNTFSSNVYFARKTGYFDAAAELKPLLHTWSLAVEEQFYVFFPLFMLLFRKIYRNLLLCLILVLVISSLYLSERWAVENPASNFYLLPTRAWELGVGAILALTASTWVRVDGLFNQVASALGVGLLSYAIFFFDDTVPFPGTWALIPVLGTAVVVAFAKPDTIVGAVLSWKPIVGIGLISYSAYLWHQPLLAFARIRLLAGVSPGVSLLLIFLALILAYFTWQFVEKPFRNRLAFSRQEVFSAAALLSLTLIALGQVGRYPENMPGRLPPEVVEMTTWAGNKNLRREGCQSTSKKFIKPEMSCVYGSDMDPDFGLLGDSHAHAVAYSLANALSEQKHGLRELTSSGCPPVTGLQRLDSSFPCPRYSDAVRDFLLSRKDPGTVILISRWTYFIEGTRFNNTEGGIEYGPPGHVWPLDKGNDFISDPTRIGAVGQLFRASIQSLLDNGKRVVLVYPVPEVGWEVPHHLARELLYGVERTQPMTTNYDVFKNRSRNAREQLDILKDHPNLVRIRPEEFFCNTFVPARCAAQLDGKPLYSDDDHLSSIGAKILVTGIVGKMKEKGWLNQSQ